MEMQYFLGKYYCVFRSTETLKDELIHGDMDIYKAEDGTCDVTLHIHVQSNSSTKRYVGKFFVNDYYDMCYVILCGNTWQEICMMIAPRFKASSHENKFLVPLVLTTSAGPTKRPTVHRMLISRKKLQGQVLELAKSQLFLNNDTIEISEESLVSLEKELQEKLELYPGNEVYIMAAKFCQIIRNLGTKETILRIEETDLLDVSRNGGSKASRSLATALIRNYSKGMYHNKISNAGPGIFNVLLDSENE